MEMLKKTYNLISIGSVLKNDIFAKIFRIFYLVFKFLGKLKNMYWIKDAFKAFNDFKNKQHKCKK